MPVFLARRTRCLLASSALIALVATLPAQAAQLPACSSVLTTAARVDLPYAGLAPDNGMGLCDGKVLVSNSGAAQVYDALSGSVVHEITATLTSPPVLVRSRNAAYFLGAGSPATTVVEFNLGTGAKRVITLSEPVYQLQGAVGRHLLVQTAVESLKRSPFPNDPSDYAYQSGFLDPASGVVMPIIGSAFGIGSSCVYFGCGGYQHLESVVTYPLSSRFIGFENTDNYYTGRVVHGVYDVDQDSLAVRYRTGLAYPWANKWVAVTPDESHVLVECDYIMIMGGMCYYDLDGATFNPISSSTETGRSEPVFTADSRLVFDGLSYQLRENSGGATTLAFTGISGYTRVGSWTSADARHAIGLFNAAGGQRMVAEPLPTPGPLPADILGPVPETLAGALATSSFFNTQRINRLFRTDLGGTRAFNTVSSSATADGTQVVVTEGDVTRTYLVKAGGVYLTRVEALVDADTATRGSATFSPAVLVLPASATAGHQATLSGTVQISVSGFPTKSTTYSGLMRVEALSRETVDGSLRDTVQMYTRISFYTYLDEMGDLLAAVRLEDRSWYARDFGIFRNVSYDQPAYEHDYIVSSTYESSSAPAAGGGGGGGGALTPWTLLLLLPLAWRRLKK